MFRNDSSPRLYRQASAPTGRDTDTTAYIEAVYNLLAIYILIKYIYQNLLLSEDLCPYV